jgi:hypothetical protein
MMALEMKTMGRGVRCDDLPNAVATSDEVIAVEDETWLAGDLFEI